MTSWYGKVGTNERFFRNVTIFGKNWFQWNQFYLSTKSKQIDFYLTNFIRTSIRSSCIFSSQRNLNRKLLKSILQHSKNWFHWNQFFSKIVTFRKMLSFVPTLPYQLVYWLWYKIIPKKYTHNFSLQFSVSFSSCSILVSWWDVIDWQLRL